MTISLPGVHTAPQLPAVKSSISILTATKLVSQTPVYLYGNPTILNIGFSTISSTPNIVSKLNGPEEKHSKMFSLGHLDFEGHFKDMGHGPGAAEVSKDFPVYLNDKERGALEGAAVRQLTAQIAPGVPRSRGLMLLASTFEVL